MPSSISSESSIISGIEFEQEGGEQQEMEQISNLKKEMRDLKNVVSAKDSELQDMKRQLDEVKNGQIAQSNRLGALHFFITLPPPNSDRKIVLPNEHKYTPDIEPFIRHGAPYCHGLTIQRGLNAFAGYPPNFFDNLIKHSCETENPEEMVANLDIAFDVSNPIPWPTVLVQVHAANLGLISKEQLEKDEMPTLAEGKVDYEEKVVHYRMGNKHKPEARFQLCIYFEGGAKCHQQMTRFTACRTDEAELKKLKEDGKTLHWAVKNGDIGLCKRLLELGANLHEKAGKFGNTPLHCASFLNEPEICVLLLDNGARLGEKNNSGNTPLHDAYLFGCHNIVDLLIGRGADEGAKNNGGKMPHEEADRYKHVPMHMRRWCRSIGGQS